MPDFDLIQLALQNGRVLPENSWLLWEAWLGGMKTIDLYTHSSYPDESLYRVVVIENDQSTTLCQCATEEEGIDFFETYCQARRAQGLATVITFCAWD